MGLNRSKIALHVALISLVGGAALSLSAGGDESEKHPESIATMAIKQRQKEAAAEASHAAEQASAEQAALPPAPIGDRTGVTCLADPAVIEDLKKHREDLAAKETEITAKEADLAAREQAVAEEMKKLEEIRDDIARGDDLRKKENEEKVAKLVETVEGMSPKASSQLLASLDEALAVATMARISTPKLSKIMNVMDPKKSSRLSEILAGVVRARALAGSAHSTAVATISSAKGGDRNDGQNSNQYSNEQSDVGNAVGEKSKVAN